MAAVTTGPRCNRCRKHLKAQSSVIRGIGPVCARSVIKHLAQGLRGHERHKLLNSLFATEVNDAILSAYDKLVLELQADECTLDTDHRTPLNDLLVKSSRVSVVEYALIIYADVCNQLSKATTVAIAVRDFFVALGLGEEAEKAYKRLIKLASKVSTF